MRSSVKEIKMGALYVWAARYRASKDVVMSLLQSRCGLNDADAKQLVAHWWTTEKIRVAVQESIRGGGPAPR